MFEEIPALLDKMTPSEQTEMLKLLDAYKIVESVKKARKGFLDFVQLVWPHFIGDKFIAGRHHKIMAQKFEEIASGKLKRLIINMPPRHTKSEFGSFLLPAWFMGRFPHKKIIESSHTGDKALEFGRKTRNLVASPQFNEIFPGVELRADSKAAGSWSTNKGGSYFAVGVGGAVAGYGADLMIIDDPHSEQDGKNLNTDAFDAAWDWYMTGPRQRLQPGGSIILIMCMTGDTDVLMGDGSSKKLRDIRPEDVVATYEDDALTTSKVNNWKSSGVDFVYTVQTQSGRILRANERHPFLVDTGGERQWIKLRDLKPGMQLVATKAVSALHGQKRTPDCVTLAKQGSVTTKETRKRRTSQLEVTGSGKANYAACVANSPSIAWESVSPATTSNTPLPNKPQNKIGQGVSGTDTGSRLSVTRKWLLNATTSVMYAATHLTAKILGLIGVGSFASTTAMKQERSGDSCATTATLRLGMGKPQTTCFAPLNTYEIVLDPIVSITTTDEREEVFDVEIDRTENFIANGVVSHNTRWSKRDLTGRLLDYAAKNPNADQWEVIEFPAIMPSGKPVWPEYWSLEELYKTKATIHPRFWAAQYQQEPTSSESAIIKKDWWQLWEKDHPPECEFIIQSWDTAFTVNTRSDYSACTTWGVFYKEDRTGKMAPNVILLDSFKEKMEFPELKEVAFKHYKEFNPDTLVVEAKASGNSLIQELRNMGIPVQEFIPVKGNDKITRVNAVADLFASGVIWCPDTRWAHELVDETADFPNGEHDDLVDSMTCALARYRQGGFLRLPSDEQDEPVSRRKAAYY
jgi:predicted phage terminase large subunit-like protein